MLFLRMMALLLGASVAAAPGAGQTAGDGPDPRQIEATSRLFFDAMNAGEMDRWLGTMSPDVETYEPVGMPPSRGHRGVLAWAQQMAGFASVRTEIHQVFVAGGRAAVTWTTHFVLADGRQVDLPGVDIHTYDRNGLIAKVEGYFDPGPLMVPTGGRMRP